MRGDFSRLAMDGGGFSQVLMQQGRVMVDADWNAAGAVLLAAQRAFAADVIGPHGGPADRLGFAVSQATTNGKADLEISPGVYYVDGIRVELGGDQPVLWSAQPFPPFFPEPPDLPDRPYLVYLDVWERLVTALEDDGLREVALGGPDTTARTQVVWQVRVRYIGDDADDGLRTGCDGFPLAGWRGALAGNPPMLRVWGARAAGRRRALPGEP